MNKPIQYNRDIYIKKENEIKEKEDEIKKIQEEYENKIKKKQDELKKNQEELKKIQEEYEILQKYQKIHQIEQNYKDKKFQLMNTFNESKKNNSFNESKKNNSYKNLTYLKNFKIINEIGDGNCQFRAFARKFYSVVTPFSIKNYAESHYDMRCLIINFLKSHKNMWCNFIDQDYESYLNVMSRDEQYGDNITLFAFVEMTGCIVIIHNTNSSQNSETIHEPKSNNNKKMLSGEYLHLLYTDLHYNTLENIEYK